MRGFRAISFSVSLCVGALVVSPTPVEATEYLFTVSCEHGSHVVAWRTGDIDPGKEWLRVATGTQNPNCSVSDFVASTDSDLPRETLEHEAGVVRGIPLIGPIVCSFFGC
jgi:hypothetical protein